jgi:hypothetical protein
VVESVCVGREFQWSPRQFEAPVVPFFILYSSRIRPNGEIFNNKFDVILSHPCQRIDQATVHVQ